MLSEGDRIWTKIPGKGFVGVGRVTGSRIPANEFIIDGRPALEVLHADYHREFAEDPEKAEYFVPVEWDRTMTVTPGWRATVERLKVSFS